MTSDERQLFKALPQTPLQRRWRQQERPVLGVVALIQRTGDNEERQEERFLLIQRRQPPYAGKWALVGGKVDFGETLAPARLSRFHRVA
jgi:ADP-ribose pyrophosphatase YjhB (NUDIX family)